MKLFFSASSGRGLTFEKDGKVYYYTGNVGNLPHDEECYKEMAKQILKQIKDEDGEEVWPTVAQVSVRRGKKEVEEPWTRRKDENDFKNGGYY